MMADLIPEAAPSPPPVVPRSFSWLAERLGVQMEPRRGAAEDCEGVLNPGGVRGPDGAFYLFPRHVGRGNYSRIGVARVQDTTSGGLGRTQRLGWALEPSPRPDAPDAYGCEDARVTYLAAWRTYAMVYTALSEHGPHLALAYSRDLVSWGRAGLLTFAPERGRDLDAVPNKDGMLFPQPVRGPDGQWAWCLLHRPITGPDGLCLWLSYLRLTDLALRGRALWAQHTVLARPRYPWEADRIGGGTVPVLTRRGWLLLYHGVAHGPIMGTPGPETAAVPGKVYCAGALLLDRTDPRQVLARSPAPLFGPKTLRERCGTMPNVVFPTALDDRGPDPIVYYGAADYCICAVRLRACDAGREET